MTNPDNIKGQGFHTNPERIGKGRPKGLLNRATIIKRWLEAHTSKDRDGNLLTAADEVVLAAIEKGKRGDISAFKELFDSVYGKVPDKSEKKIEGDVKVKITFGT